MGYSNILSHLDSSSWGHKAHTTWTQIWIARETVTITWNRKFSLPNWSPLYINIIKWHGILLVLAIICHHLNQHRHISKLHALTAHKSDLSTFDPGRSHFNWSALFRRRWASIWTWTSSRKFISKKIIKSSAELWMCPSEELSRITQPKQLIVQFINRGLCP